MQWQMNILLSKDVQNMEMTKEINIIGLLWWILKKINSFIDKFLNLTSGITLL